ncbi:hypothetical protein [Abyssisolibacter fermentans]|uniref:hypothetical protein n=1 Tax=Abyssisolibacter fermentans TaxID=1766203 RepID=UPI0012E3734E|nr:hypothetical protein [Abyssisolibacter fermentans]
MKKLVKKIGLNTIEKNTDLSVKCLCACMLPPLSKNSFIDDRLFADRRYYYQ